MAKRAHVYPNVTVDAEALINVPLARAAAGLRAGDALRLARREHAGAVVVGGEAVVLSEDLGRAVALGLPDLAAEVLARPLPTVSPHDGEVGVRRRLMAGAPIVVVRAGRRPLGGVADPTLSRGEGTGPSMASHLGAGLPPGALALLTTIGAVARARGERAFLVGGLVRDAWLGRVGDMRDLDVVVEGDGLAVARALAAALDGTMVEHTRFLTASVEHGGGRVDVATARAERYEAPGALPRVIPAGIAEDLRRRDFTINAMAVELASGGFGLLDPLGGRADVMRRRLRVLHPLSFVEDPTRVLRAARYAARLGFAEDAWTARARGLALDLAPYAALSGQRIAAELGRLLGEEGFLAALRRLGATGGFRLLDPRYRFTVPTRRRLGAVAEGLAWARGRNLPVPGLELVTLALLEDQAPEIGRAVLGRLALAGEPLARVSRAIDGWRTGDRESRDPALAASERARVLRKRTPLELAWGWTTGDAWSRARLDEFVTGERDGRPTLSGDDVIALGVPRGPLVALALGALRDARLDGAVADRAAEVDHVRQWLRTRSAERLTARKER